MTQQLIGIAIEGGGQSLKDVGQIRLWLVSAGLGGVDQAVNDSGRATAASTARVEPVLSSNGDLSQVRSALLLCIERRPSLR